MSSKPMNRAAGMKYKEKFNAMRHKYEQVVARHEDYQRQLDTANAKMKKLQTENDLLLDVIAAGQRPPPPNNPTLDPTQPFQQQHQQPSQPPPPHQAPPLSHQAPYPYPLPHEGPPYPLPTTVMQGPSPNYPLPAPPNHNHRSPHLVHVNGERGSRNARPMESHERTEIVGPLHPPSQPHHNQQHPPPPPPVPSASEYASHEPNGRHQ